MCRFLLQNERLEYYARKSVSEDCICIFTQLFFIQPFLRTVFKVLFRRDIEEQSGNSFQAALNNANNYPIIEKLHVLWYIEIN